MQSNGGGCVGVQHWRVGTRSTGGKKAEEEAALTGPTAPLFFFITLSELAWGAP
jgi:hypothetical protein